MKPTEAIALVAFIALCFAVSVAGGLITATSVGTWYQTLNKPPFNPPDWVFAPVWTTLYALMAIAAWRVWRRVRHGEGRGALVVFAAQLALNLVWSFLFFGLQRIDLATVQIFVLLVAVATTAVMFWRVDRTAGVLLLPYVLWVGYASVLNVSLWMLN